MRKITIKLYFPLLLLVFPMMLKGQVTENIVLDVPVLVPKNNTNIAKCIKAALEMGFQDINSEIVQYTDNENVTRRFTFNALYEEIGSRPIDAVEAMNRFHPFDFDNFRDITAVKRASVGVPFDEQTNIFSDFGQVLPNIQYSYAEINEPYDTKVSLYLQSPPSITGQFYAARSFMEVYNWKQAVIVYDFSNTRYRLSSNLLIDILQEDDHKIKVVSSTRIRGYDGENERADLNELPNLPYTEARIVFLLAGVPGIRQTFCQAYHLRLQKSHFVWLLFEELPNGWASSQYDQVIINGKKHREINCTEEQLLSVSESFIYFTKGGYREDNQTTISNVTVTQFKQKLKKLAGVNEECDVKAAYAYDSIWSLVKSHQEIMKGQQGVNFYQNFIYFFGLGVSGYLAPLVRKTNFEGITGNVSYQRNGYKNNIRLGFASIRVQHGRNASILVGIYMTQVGVLKLVPNATTILFNDIIPSHKATYIRIDYNYPKEYIIVIWFLAFAGIITALTLTLIAITCDHSNASLSGRMASIMIDSIISFGCILCYTSLVVYGIDTRFVERDRIVDVCYGFLCTLSIGFTLTFGALFAKTWWKYKSFSAPSAIRSQTGSKISEWSLFILIAIFLFVDIIIIVCWTVVSPFSIEIYEGEKTRLSFAQQIQEIIKCRYSIGFTIGMFCYKGTLLVFGVFLAWQTNSKLRGTNSKTVSLAIYNTALVSVVGVVCVLLLEKTDHRHALYSIIAVCVVLCTTTTLAMIYVPKLSKIFSLSSEENSSNDSENDSTNKAKFNKFTLEKLRRRVTNRSSKFPSVSSMQTNVSTISISNPTSSLDSRRTTATAQTEMNGRTSSFGSEQQRASSFTTDSSSNVGSFVSYNPSLVQSSTVLEVPSEEEEEQQQSIGDDIIIENHQNIEKKKENIEEVHKM